MSDPIRHLLAIYVHAHATGNSVPPHLDAEARAALATEPPAPDADAVLSLAAIIRCVDGSHSLGAEAMAEGILSHPAAANVFQPPEPDPHEALAVRPLLEAVVALEVYNGPLPALQQRISAWLAENPPGQPVAIEPRGCPAPGACSCVEPPAPEADAALSLAAIIRQIDGSNSLGAAELADAILLHPNAASVFQPPAPDHFRAATEMAEGSARLRQCPTHGQQPAHTWGCPECLRELREELARVKATAANGEREELADRLGWIAAQLADIGWGDDSASVARAAALLRQTKAGKDQAGAFALHLLSRGATP